MTACSSIVERLRDIFESEIKENKGKTETSVKKWAKAHDQIVDLTRAALAVDSAGLRTNQRAKTTAGAALIGTTQGTEFP